MVGADVSEVGKWRLEKITSPSRDINSLFIRNAYRDKGIVLPEIKMRSLVVFSFKEIKKDIRF